MIHYLFQVTSKFRGVNNPYDNGCVRNCVFVLCSPKKPRYMHYQLKGATNPMANLNHRPHSQQPSGVVQGQDLPLQDAQSAPMYEELDQHHAAAALRLASEQNVRSFLCLLYIRVISQPKCTCCRQ